MVRCADCGLLAVRNPNTFMLEEMDEWSRERGRTNYPARDPSDQVSVMMAPAAIPLCSVMAYDLLKEIKDQGRLPNATSLAVIQKDRDCRQFSTWHRGFLPKEHKQMLLDIEERKRADSQRFRDKWSDFAISALAAILGSAATYFLTRPMPEKPVVPLPAPVVNVSPVIQPPTIIVQPAPPTPIQIVVPQTKANDPKGK